jgi:hypothetical protein
MTSIKSQAPSHEEQADTSDNSPAQIEIAHQKYPARSLTAYTLNCALVASVGSLLYGIDSGIISTTISQKSYLSYFAPYTR